MVDTKGMFVSLIIVAILLGIVVKSVFDWLWPSLKAFIHTVTA